MVTRIKWLWPNSTHIVYVWARATVMAHVPPYIYLVALYIIHVQGTGDQSATVCMSRVVRPLNVSGFQYSTVTTLPA